MPALVRLLTVALFAVVAAAPAAAQDFKPGAAVQVDAQARMRIVEKTEQLDKAIAALRTTGLPKPFKGLEDQLLTEIEVYSRAAKLILQHNEFFQKDSEAWTLEALDRGLARAKQASDGKYDWLKATGKTVIRAYRSMLDGSAQPFAVTFPENYGSSKSDKYRLDVVLHGRDKNLNEVKFLHQFGDKKAPADLNYIRIDIYGRGNNAYRWAGEIDVLEAKLTLELFENLLGRGRFIDRQRRVLRGFSMGGAGTWHLGLHHPDRWCVLGPGAGFSSTHGYVGKLPDDLGWPQEQMLRIYDAVAYAENAFNVPIVAYAGSKDPQLKAAKNIEALLKPTGLPVQFQILVAPDLEHKFPPEWQKKAEEAYAPFVARGRADYPPRVRFVTHTLRYNRCDWIDIIGLEKHYEKALVDAEKTEEGFKVSTANISLLRLRVPHNQLQDMAVVIDKQEFNARPWGIKGGDHYVYLQKKDGRWKATMPQRIAADDSRTPRKTSGLQGPIDDAFTMPFLVVRGTGQPWSQAVDSHAEANLKRFRHEWSKYFRGELPVKDDNDVNGDDIASKHLILFGDPGSNTLLAQVLDALPLQWTKDKLTLAGKSFAAPNHVPALIYPSPLNPSKYIVLNSGHTFHAADFEGTNALLYPRLGDYAVLRIAEKGPALAGETVVLNGLFDESWRVMAGK